MFIVIFEVYPRPERREEYLQRAGKLRPALTASDGFLENERFTSVSHEGKVLSVSTWRDEQSLARWRSHDEHRDAQMLGRTEVFEDYRLRVGEITMQFDEVESASLDSPFSTATSNGLLTLTQIYCDAKERSETVDATLNAWMAELAAARPVAVERFNSINVSAMQLWLAAWPDGSAWRPSRLPGGVKLRQRLVRIIRDYGMFERGEAPQYYPPTKSRRSDSAR